MPSFNRCSTGSMPILTTASSGCSRCCGSSRFPPIRPSRRTARRPPTILRGKLPRSALRPRSGRLPAIPRSSPEATRRATVTARRGVIVPASRRAFAAKVALVTFALAGKIALVAFAGELPFPAPCGKGAVLAAATPAAGSVVFIVVAGHEGLVSNEARMIRCACGAH